MLAPAAPIEVRRKCLPQVILACLVLALTQGCSQPEPEPAPEVARPVKLLKIATGATGAVLEYPGQVAPTLQSDMAFEVAGKIVELPVTEGQAVEKGQVLARLDARDMQTALDAELAKQRSAKANYDRMKTLFDQGIASRQELDDVTRNLDIVNANVRTAEKRVEDAVLRAPFAGRVAKKSVADFANVQAKQVVLVLQDDSRLEVKVTIPERDFRFNDKTMTAEERMRRAEPEVEISAFPGRRFPARITEISTTADPTTRTFTATISFDPPEDLIILSGMTAKVIVRRQLAPGSLGLEIPANAVVGDADAQPFVWKLDPQTMRVSRTPVQLGAMRGDRIAVTGGLADGDEIAVSGVHNLREGMEVRRFAD